MNAGSLRLSIRFQVADERTTEYRDWLRSHVLAAATAAPVSGFQAFCHPDDPCTVEFLFEFPTREQYETFIDSAAFRPFEESLEPLCVSFDRSLTRPMAVPLESNDSSTDDTEARSRDSQLTDGAIGKESSFFRSQIQSG